MCDHALLVVGSPLNDPLPRLDHLPLFLLFGEIGVICTPPVEKFSEHALSRSCLCGRRCLLFDELPCGIIEDELLFLGALALLFEFDVKQDPRDVVLGQQSLLERAQQGHAQSVEERQARGEETVEEVTVKRQGDHTRKQADHPVRRIHLHLDSVITEVLVQSWQLTMQQLGYYIAMLI